MQCAYADCRLWPVPLYSISPHYLTNGTIFETKSYQRENVFHFFLQISSEIFLILRRIQRDSIINVHRSFVKYTLFLSGFNENGIFSIDFREILKY
jgi:hypothetical protein